MSEAPHTAGEQRTRPHLREGLILASFLLLVAAAVVTVVIPELEDRDETEGTTTSQDVPDAGT